MSDRTRDEAAAVRTALDKMADTLAEQLPPHIPVARFVAAAMTAVQRNPDLLVKCDRGSLYMACKEAAEDGLLPDGREGAIVPVRDTQAGITRATWFPMVAGLVKLAWQCGALASLHADAAYVGEPFEVWGGTDARIVHQYALAARGNGGTLDNVIAIYAVAKLTSGETMQAVLTPSEVAKIRNLSKAKNGPWGAWPVAMAQVRAVRRLTKLLPLSSDRDADARMRRAAERGDAIDGVAEDTTDQRALAAPAGDKLAALEQALDLPPVVQAQPEPQPAQQAPEQGYSEADLDHISEPSPERTNGAPQPDDKPLKAAKVWASKITRAATEDDLAGLMLHKKLRQDRQWYLDNERPELDAMIAEASGARYAVLTGGDNA